MIKQGIRHMEIGFVSMSKIYIHTPGVYEYEADRKATIQSSLGKKAYYMIEHEILQMLDDKSKPCKEDPNYNKDTCAQDEIEMFVMKEYGCTPPFVENKEKICTNETIAKQVMQYWDSMKYGTNCPDRCKEILIRAMWMRNKSSDAPEHMLARSSLGARSFDWCSYSGFDIEQMLEARSCSGLMLGSTRRALGMEKV